MAKFTAPAGKSKVRVPMGKPHHGPLSGHKRGASAPPAEHKKGGNRLSRQSGAKGSPLCA